MTDRPRLLTGLLARRAETVADISRVEAQLRQHYETLRSLDHLIRLECLFTHRGVSRSQRASATLDGLAHLATMESGKFMNDFFDVVEAAVHHGFVLIWAVVLCRRP